MKYTVLWTPTAEKFLAELWTDANDRSAVSAAADAIDRLLSEDAHLRGESRFGKLRIVFEGPLAVHFNVISEDCTAYVLTVWRSHRNES